MFDLYDIMPTIMLSIVESNVIALPWDMPTFDVAKNRDTGSRDNHPFLRPVLPSVVTAPDGNEVITRACPVVNQSPLPLCLRVSHRKSPWILSQSSGSREVIGVHSPFDKLIPNMIVRGHLDEVTSVHPMSAVISCLIHGLATKRRVRLLRNVV